MKDYKNNPQDRDSYDGPKYYGKYQAIVVDNEDPMFLGRITFAAPAFPGMIDTFAWPCVPYAGEQVGFCFTPPLGASVWIEFEEGDPNHPIWTGCFWKEAEMPEEAEIPEVNVLVSPTINLMAPKIQVEGITTISGETNITGICDIDTVGDISILGNFKTTLGDLSVDGALSVDGDLSVDGVLSANGALSANGDLSANGALIADGVLTVNGLLTANLALAVTGGITLDGIPIP